MSVSTRLGGLAATAALVAGGAMFVPTAHADEAPAPAPCAGQQAKVDKAEAALERVTAVFARQQTRVVKAKKVVAQAEAGRAKAAARKALADAKQDRDETKVTKRAQQQRLAKAEERLATCEAEVTPPRPRPRRPRRPPPPLRPDLLISDRTPHASRGGSCACGGRLATTPTRPAGTGALLGSTHAQHPRAALPRAPARRRHQGRPGRPAGAGRGRVGEALRRPGRGGPALAGGRRRVDPPRRPRRRLRPRAQPRAAGRASSAPSTSRSR